jgi:hypothetical protein
MNKYMIITTDDNEEILGTGVNLNSFVSCLRFVVFFNFLNFKMLFTIKRRYWKKLICWAVIVRNKRINDRVPELKH